MRDKIQTVDCVVAITKHFFDKETDNHSLLRPSLWKRKSKTGSGDNIFRTFFNKETGTNITVISSEYQIFHVLEETPNITNVKEYLKDKINNSPEGFYGLSYEIINDITNWPNVQLDDGEEVYDEPLDTENFEWISVSDDEFVIACGGDWQDPLTLTIKLLNGKLTVISSIPGYNEGLDEKGFISSLYI